MNAYEALGLAPGTTDPAAIRRAYAEKLRIHRPDEDPAGFARIRAAKDYLLGAGAASARPPDDASGDEPDDDRVNAPAPPPREPEPRAKPTRRLDEQLANLLANGTQAARINAARNLVANPGWVAEIRSSRDVIRLAEEIAFDQPEVAGKLGAIWFESARGDERQAHSLDELDRRRALATLAGSYPVPARRVIFAMALGTPSTDPSLSGDLALLEAVFPSRAPDDPLLPWLQKVHPSDPLTLRLAEVRRRGPKAEKTRAAGRRAASTPPRKRAKEPTPVAVIIGMVFLVNVVRTCMKSPAPPPTSDLLEPWRSPPIRFPPSIEPLRPKPGDGGPLDDDMRRLIDDIGKSVPTDEAVRRFLERKRQPPPEAKDPPPPSK